MTKHSNKKFSDEEFLEVLLLSEPPLRQVEIARIFGVSKNCIHLRLKKEGLSEDYKIYVADYKIELEEAVKRFEYLKAEKTRRANQRNYEVLEREKGLDYALAWRFKEILCKVKRGNGNTLGKRYPLEELEKLIHYRRRDNGFKVCLELSGLPTTPADITYVREVLDRTLHDIDYSQRRCRHLSSEEKKEFKKLYPTFTKAELNAHFGFTSKGSVDHLARKFGLKEEKN